MAALMGNKGRRIIRIHNKHINTMNTVHKGDTERQAALRDKILKQGDELKDDRFVSHILSVFKPETRLLDIGCGTGHIIQALAQRRKDAILVGLDVSGAMIRIANRNTSQALNVALIEADGRVLPFQTGSFDIVTSRLSEYFLTEVHRVLKNGGYFFECGLGPDADKEIAEFFPDRIEKENFCIPMSPDSWKDDISRHVHNAGFDIISMNDYRKDDYYKDEDEVMDLIEMVPLVRGFSREKDSRIVERIANKYGDERGIRITWHYYIIEAKRP